MILPDFRYSEEITSNHLTSVAFINTASKSTEEEKPQITKKVGHLDQDRVGGVNYL